MTPPDPRELYLTFPDDRHSYFETTSNGANQPITIEHRFRFATRTNALLSDDYCVHQGLRSANYRGRSKGWHAMMRPSLCTAAVRDEAAKLMSRADPALWFIANDIMLPPDMSQVRKPISTAPHVPTCADSDRTAPRAELSDSISFCGMDVRPSLVWRNDGSWEPNFIWGRRCDPLKAKADGPANRLSAEALAAGLAWNDAFVVSTFGEWRNAVRGTIPDHGYRFTGTTGSEVRSQITEVLKGLMRGMRERYVYPSERSYGGDHYGRRSQSLSAIEAGGEVEGEVESGLTVAPVAKGSPARALWD